VRGADAEGDGPVEGLSANGAVVVLHREHGQQPSPSLRSIWARELSAWKDMSRRPDVVPRKPERPVGLGARSSRPGRHSRIQKSSPGLLKPISGTKS
jgi:hypothetical protein